MIEKEVKVKLPFEGSCVKETGVAEGIRRVRIGFMIVKIIGLAVVASSYEFVSEQKSTLSLRIKHSKPFKIFQTLREIGM